MKKIKEKKEECDYEPGYHPQTKEEKNLKNLYNKKMKYKQKLNSEQHNFRNNYNPHTELDTLKTQIDDLDDIHTKIEKQNENISADMKKIYKMLHRLLVKKTLPTQKKFVKLKPELAFD
jgi:hypothetical protein